MELRSRNTKLFYLFSLFYGFQFFWPILVLYQREMLDSFSSIAAIQTFSNILIIFLEVPSGYFADKFGRKITVNISIFFHILALLLYSVMTKWETFLLIEIFWAIGTVAFSGSYQAFRYESIMEGETEKEISKKFARFTSISTFTLALSNIGGSIIAQYMGKNTTFFITAVFFLFSFIILQFIPEKKKEIDIDGEYVELLPKTFLKENIEIIKSIIHNVRLRHNFLDMLLVNGLIYISFYYTQPMFQDFGISVLYFGFIFAGINFFKSILLPILISYTSEVENDKVFTAINIFYIISFCAIYFIQNDVFYIITIASIQLLNEVRMVIYNTINNALIENKYRATIFSYYSLANSAILSIILLAFAALADVYSIHSIYLIIGICFVGILFYRRKMKL